MSGLWRRRATQVINETLADHPGVTGAECQKVLRDVYPFGMRQYYPYQVWLQCVREACGIKPRVQPLSQLPMFEGDGG